MENDNAVGRRIAEIRRERNVTQEYMAEKLHIARSSYNKMENGAKRILDRDLKAIAEILKVSSDRLLGISTSRPPSGAPKLNLTIEFTEDDAVPDGPLVKRLSEMIRQLNSGE